MLCFPNCKINIGLYITSRRSDGYHNIETLFYPIVINDVLEIVPSAITQLQVSGIPVSGDVKDNLVVKAYDLLSRKFPGKIPNVDIYLHKIIPSGAGLGGGSADGAFMLKLLNDYCRLGLTNKELADLALQLGSDCPFFIYNRPQYATGRGENMLNLSVDLSEYNIQVIVPKIHVSTKEAFGMISPKPASFDLRHLPQLKIEEWKTHIANDFEIPVFEKYPELSEIKNQLYDSGAVYASMTGSGSAIYGIFPKGKKAEIELDLPSKSFYAE